MQVQKEIRKGAAIIFISKYSGVIVGIIINSTLARLLSPNEYGTVGIVTVFITFFNILSDVGMSAGVIQNQSLTPHNLSDIFKCSGILSFALALVFNLAGFAISNFYNNNEYIFICRLLSLHLFFSAFAMVPRSILIKQRAFKTLGIIEISTSLFTGILAILLATMDFSYYAIIWRSIISSMIVFSFYLYFSKLSLYKGISTSGLRKIASYSSYQFAFNFINYFSRNLDNILIGKYMGNTSLGIYNQAYQLMVYPISYLTNVITPVLHPILAKFQDNKPLIFKEYIKVAGLLAKIGFPISIFIYFSSPEIIFVMLGSQWEGVIPILKTLSISIWVQMILSSSGAIFQASGRTDLLFVSGLLSAVVVVGSILVGILVFKSILATAILLVISYYINFIQAFFLLIKKVLGNSLTTFSKIITDQIPLAITLILLLFIFDFTSSKTGLHLPLVLSLVIKIGIAGGTFLSFNFSVVGTYYKRFFSKT